jgi:CheY-like chemotaxis protein
MVAADAPAEILLVEDNPADVRLTMKAFEEGGIGVRVTVAEDGERALEILRRQGEYARAPMPDLILLDLNLPKVDGREVLAAVKEDPELRQIPVIVLTGSNARADILTSYRLHANCYIRKPFSFAELAEAVKTIEDFWLTLVTLPKND